LVSDETGAQIILRRWRFGVEEYHSVIFASAESGITSLEELPGHMIAMDAPYSTSGFMLPAVAMVESGLKLVGKRGQGVAVADDEVGFIFSYDDENTLQWVLSGLVAAGVTDDYHFDVAFPEEVTQKLVVLARTEPTPRQVVVARSDLEPELLEAIKQVLINVNEDESGQGPLEAFQTTQFDEFPEGIEAAIAHMREMMEIAKDISLP
jgi:phosphonate transport system substrate-binding protein